MSKIIDKIDKNNFGVLFHTTAAIEAFQEQSGMEGSYSLEYQHHYWNAVGRLKTEGQRLDIAIPLVLIHYHQEVSGAAIEFNLGEVGTASNAASKLVEAKFKELQETEFFGALVNDMGIIDWEIVPMNSIHAHPTGVNRFSGTDLRTDINHPGVNFPLNTGVDIPNFASIIQHKQDFAEIIHTEYRLFNCETDKDDRVYEKGRCLTLIRGFANPEPEPAEFEGDGIIDKIFKTTRHILKAFIAEKDRESYVLKDGLTGDEGDEISEELGGLWNACEFEPDVSLIEEKNVIRGAGRLQKEAWRGKGLFKGVNYATHRNPSVKGREREGVIGEEENDNIVDLVQKHNERIFLIDAGYSYNELRKMTVGEFDEIYILEKQAETAYTIVKQDEKASEYKSTEDMLDDLIDAQIMGEEKLRMMARAHLEKLYLEIFGEY